MLVNSEVSLLVTEPEASGKVPQALARVTIQGKAEILDRDSEKYSDAREVYLSRFPDAAPLFEFSDFSIFVIQPVSARVIAGFGQAETVTGKDLAAILAAAP
jgi:putative heme iron utilization protein